MTVKVGQDVAFEGDFSIHPISSAGGDTPNPFSSFPPTGKFRPNTAGTFGFTCLVHASMTGVIKVVP
jgi:plastocyanin